MDISLLRDGCETGENPHRQAASLCREAIGKHGRTKAFSAPARAANLKPPRLHCTRDGADGLALSHKGFAEGE
jgi:hypothetical protein